MPNKLCPEVILHSAPLTLKTEPAGYRCLEQRIGFLMKEQS